MSRDEASLLLGFCRNLVSSATSSSASLDDVFSSGVAAGDIVFNITIDTPALTLPNMQITGYNVDMGLSVSDLHVPLINYAAYGGLMMVQLFTFVVLLVGYLCVVRPLQRRVRRLHGVMARYNLVDHHAAGGLADEDNGDGDTADGGGGEYVILEKDGVQYQSGRGRMETRSRAEQACHGCGRGCPADAHFCSCCGRPLSFLHHPRSSSSYCAESAATAAMATPHTPY